MDNYHFHDQYEVLLPLSGGIEMFVTDQCYRLERGTLLLLPPSVLHRSIGRTQESYQRYVLQFSEHSARGLSTRQTNLLRSFSKGCTLLQLNEAQIATLAERYQACMETPEGYGADLKSQMAFLSLLLCVDEFVQQEQTMLPVAAGGIPACISELLTYIPSHLQEDLSLDCLASRCFLSKTQLCRLFRDSTGFSLGHYIIQTRILRACVLLQSGASVQRAGEQVGFQSDSHFIRTFHNIMDMAPGQYRKSARQSSTLQD